MKNAYEHEQHRRKQHEEYMYTQYLKQSGSWSPNTTRVACSMHKRKKPARPQKPPNALRNAADSPSAVRAPQDARGTVLPGVGVVNVPKAAMKDEQAEAASTPAGGTPAAPVKESEAAHRPTGGTPAVMQQAVKAVKT